MAKTKIELSTAVLRNIRVAPASGTPSPEAAANVEGRYDSKMAEWRRRGLVWWPNTNRSTAEIPAEVFQTLCELMENEVAYTFGKAPLDSTVRRAQEEMLLAGLRRLNVKPPSGEPTVTSPY